MSANILPGGRWQAFARDISERKRIGDERQVFVSLLDNSSDFIGIADPTGKPVYLNPAGRRLVGIPADYPIKDTQIPEYYPPEERAFATDVILKTVLESGRWTGETVFRHWQTERAIPVSFDFFRIYDPSGERVLGMGNVTRDISEARRTTREREELLAREQRARLQIERAEEDQRFLAEAGAVLAASLDYEQTLTTVGRLMVRAFANLCVLEILEQPDRPGRLRAVGAHPNLAPLCAQLEQLRLDPERPHLAGTVFDTRRPFILEQVTPQALASLGGSEAHLRLLRAIGPRSLIAVPLLIHGQLQGVMVLISNTPSRTYKPADLRLAEALAERAALALENGRLYQTALRATRLRDEVLGIVAHDLRNPVAAIMMMTTVLKRAESDPSPRSEKAREGILRAANRMNRLIGDLLDVTLVEVGQLAVRCERLSTRQLVVDSVDVQRPLASSASIELHLQLPDDLPDIWADQHRVLQVLDNLVGNGIKFTPVEGSITVGAAPRDGEVLFWVADTGAGISPDGLPHVFDRFWQARKGTRLGAGLGLPISRGIVEAHGGRLWVESKLGRGTIFFFTIPRWDAAEDRRSQPTVHSSTVRGGAIRRSRRANQALP